MNFIVGALQQLIAEDKVVRQKAGEPLIEGSQACRLLGNTLEKFRQEVVTLKLHPPKLDVQKIWAMLAAANYDLSGLNAMEVRTLCCAPETALQPEFINALKRSPDKLKQDRSLFGLVINYFAVWRQMPDPCLVENLLCNVCTSYRGGNPALKKWSSSKHLFSEQSASFLAGEICSDQKSVDEVLKTYFVDPITKLGLSARASSACLAAQNLRHVEAYRDEAWSLDYLRWMIERIFSDNTSADSFSEAISLLILSESAKRSETFRLALSAFIRNDKKLGDPRLRESAPNWRPMKPEAAQRYLSWLAKDSILFFFNTILPDTNENRRRKDFWLRYHNCIKDFQVAVSEEDFWKVKSGHKASEVISYSRVDHPTTSAFLMQFEGYGKRFLVVEFSETGNAAYIFQLEEFLSLGVSLRTPRFDLKKHLKYNKEHRIFHSGSWEAKAVYSLAMEFGIRP